MADVADVWQRDQRSDGPTRARRHRTSALAWVGLLVGMTTAPVALAPAVAASTHAATHTAKLATPTASTKGPAWETNAQHPCDKLTATQCLLPFPNDYFTAPDASMATGRRVDLPPGSLPRTTKTTKTTLTTTAWDGNDGFSPGDALLVHVPDISLAKSHVATISDMGDSVSKTSPIVLVDTTTKQWWPTWAELDANDKDPATQLLVIHPAKNLPEGAHIDVALRNLETASGKAIHARCPFESVLGTGRCHTAGHGIDPAYGAHLEQVVKTLGSDGVSTGGLYLAWDFTVDSATNLTGPELAMRNEAFKALGTQPPSYTVTTVVTAPTATTSITHSKTNLPDQARQIEGTFTVPSFLTGTEGTPGTTLTEGTDGLPVQEHGATQTATFWCEIPKAASAAHPATVGIYGHGLFNSGEEVFTSWVPAFSNTDDYVFCGTTWVGLSKSTLDLAIGVVTNLSQFPSMVDNLMQSLVNAQVLGRLLDTPNGLAKNAAFQTANGQPLVNADRHLVYYGNSEGGIMGGAFAAVSTDTDRAVLGVPGMDYAVLLPRSADFLPFLSPLDTHYPTKAEQLIGFDLIQMLWDRGEADGYAEQMTGGLPGTPDHQVMLEETFGDHQVANIATETEARTIGASLREPALAKGRSNEAEPFWDLPALKPDSKGPALTIWDSGVPAPPRTDIPPTKGPDPHDTTPRSVPAFWAQMNTFFQTGIVSNTCGSGPCKAPYP